MGRQPSGPQREALAMDGDGRILAGAGAGKTSTIVWMCARDLLEAHVAPRELLVTSFTRVAAGEIRERLSTQLRGTGISEAEMYAGTIDAVCFDLVRERALDLGLPPALGVALPEQLTDISRRAFAAARDQVGADRMRDLHPFVDPADTTAVRRTVEKLFDRGASLNCNLESVFPAGLTPLTDIDIPTLAADFERFIPFLRDNVQTRAKADLRALRAGEPELVSGFHWGTLRSDIRDQADDLRERLHHGCRQLADRRAAPAREALAQLLRIYASARSDLSRREGTMGYTDIALATVVGLIGGVITRRFDRVYVDEAQDTNPLQLRIVQGLRAPTGRIVMIGDVNQSIYAFRNTDPDQFAELDQETFPQQVFLSENYRTSPHILTAISSVARSLPELTEIAAGMEPRVPARPDDPPFEVLCVAADKYPPPPVSVEALTAVPHIEARRKELGVGRGDVAVLCRTRKSAGRWADAFRAAGIPALVLQSGGVLETHECVCALDYLQLINDPGDSDALLAVLSGPAGGLTPEVIHAVMSAAQPLAALSGHAPQLAALLASHHGYVGVLGVEETARRALEEVGYLDAWARADPSGTAVRNVDGLLRRIGEIARDGHDFSRTLGIVANDGDSGAQPAPPAPDIDAVRVMTIHGAKGEEYDLVVVAGISTKEPNFDDVANINTADHIGVLVRGKGGSKRQGRPTWGDPLAVHEKERRDALEASEQRRMMYVAMTRARRGLMVVLSGFVNHQGYFDHAKPSVAEWFGPKLIGPRGLPSIDRPTRVDVRDSDARIKVTRLAVGDTGGAAIVEAVAQPAFPPPARAACAERAPRPVSFTALASWRRCGLRRRMERNLGLSATFAGSAPEVGGAAALGRYLHDLLAVVDFSTPLEPQVAALTARADRRLGDDSDRRHAARVLGRLTQLGALTNRLSAAQRVRTELRFDVREPFPLGGRLDVLAELDADAVLVVDWKTGVDPQDAFSDDYDLQRDLYGAAVFSLFPHAATVDAMWVHLGDELVPRVAQRTYRRDELSELTAGLNELVDSVMGMPSAAASTTPQFFCRDCPGLRRICPVSKNAAQVPVQP